MSVQDLQQLLLTYSLLLPRIISCFVVLPVLAKQTLGGGLVRNGVACSLALFAYPIVAGSLPPALDALDIALLIGKEVLLGLPAHSPGVVITQHMPPGFTRSFAERLDRLTRLSVSEARDGDRILPGHALVAPGDHHMEVQRSGANYVVRLNRQAQVNGHRPAVDVMFESLARCAGRNLLAGLLTGMGKDGARGLLAIRQAGGYTLAQDEATCVVYGMPREAVELGAAEDVLPLERIAAVLLQQAARRGSGNRL